MRNRDCIVEQKATESGVDSFHGAGSSVNNHDGSAGSSPTRSVLAMPDKSNQQELPSFRLNEIRENKNIIRRTTSADGEDSRREQMISKKNRPRRFSDELCLQSRGEVMQAIVGSASCEGFSETRYREDPVIHAALEAAKSMIYEDVTRTRQLPSRAAPSPDDDAAGSSAGEIKRAKRTQSSVKDGAAVDADGCSAAPESSVLMADEKLGIAGVKLNELTTSSRQCSQLNLRSSSVVAASGPRRARHIINTRKRVSIIQFGTS